MERLVGPFLLQGQLPTACLLRRHQDLHLREREGQEAQILQQPTPSREGVGGSFSDAQIMDPAAVGVAQKEDDEERIDEQDIFDGVVFFLPAITLGLFRGVLGADDAPLGAVMGKRGAAGATTGAGASSREPTTEAAAVDVPLAEELPLVAPTPSAPVAGPPSPLLPMTAPNGASSAPKTLLNRRIVIAVRKKTTRSRTSC